MAQTFYQQERNKAANYSIQKVLKAIPQLIEDIFKGIITLGKMVVTQFFGR